MMFHKASLFLVSLCILAEAKKTAEDYPLFAADSVDVLTNVYSGDYYDAVYLQYHRCVWSEYGNGADEAENGCAGDGNEDHWYMGRTQCYRSNVAYSLYGVKTGNDTPDNPCAARNFINSYFTNRGVEYFAGSMNLDYGYATSTCTAESADDDFNNNQDVNYANNGGLYPDSYSYTTSCTVDGSFVQAKFGGAYCSGRNRIENVDTLDNFNSELANYECVQVYDQYGTYAMNQQNDQNDQNDEGEGEDGENEGDRRLEDQGDNGSLFNLLAYSSECSTFEYPRACPDPWGVKTLLDWNPLENEEPMLSWMDWVGIVFFGIGVFLLLLTCCMRRHKNRRKNRNGDYDDDDQPRGFWGKIRRWWRRKVLRRRN